MHSGIVVHHVDERALLAILHCHVGDDQLIGQGIHQQPYIDELLREERIVLVVENRLQLRGAGGIVDLVIHGHQRAGRQFFGIVAVIGIHRQMRTRPQLLRDLRKVVLGDGE